MQTHSFLRRNGFPRILESRVSGSQARDPEILGLRNHSGPPNSFGHPAEPARPSESGRTQIGDGRPNPAELRCGTAVRIRPNSDWGRPPESGRKTHFFNCKWSIRPIGGCFVWSFWDCLEFLEYLFFECLMIFWNVMISSGILDSKTDLLDLRN